MDNRKAKVFIIDDEEDFCHFVKLNLEHSGKFQVLTATKALAGITTAKAQAPDVILLDILMPDMDGSQVAESLLNDEATKRIPIIFLTALAQRKEVEDTNGIIGGRTFIAKPVTPDELVKRIEEAIGK